jgi:hypothetical protein
MIAIAMSQRRRRALEILADAGRHGSADPLFLAQFTPELRDLVRDGLAMVQAERTMARGRTIEVARVRITDAGRVAVEGPFCFTWH